MTSKDSLILRVKRNRISFALMLIGGLMILLSIVATVHDLITGERYEESEPQIHRGNHQGPALGRPKEVQP